MSKSKEEQARREGMSYALRYAREHGLDALETDLKKRIILYEKWNGSNTIGR